MKEHLDCNTYNLSGKRVTVYPSKSPASPIVYLNSSEEEEEQIYRALEEFCCPDFTLVTISGLDWNHDMTPWNMQPAFQGAHGVLAVVLVRGEDQHGVNIGLLDQLRSVQIPGGDVVFLADEVHQRRRHVGDRGDLVFVTQVLQNGKVHELGDLAEADDTKFDHKKTSKTDSERILP